MTPLVMTDQLKRHAPLRLLLYGAFVVYGLVRFIGSPGDDLSSSYIGCRLLAAGESAHLYDFHPVFFHVVDTAAWINAAAEVRFTGVLHPYVQTPLWAWSLQPLCTTLSFQAFSTAFIAIAMIALVALIELVARNWAPKFQSPLPLAALLGAIAATTPYQYAMWLVQTHVVFLALAVGAIIAAERGRSALAGGMLAVAAAVKITPGLLVIYWLIKKQYRAAAWFTGWSILLLAVTTLTAGIEPTLDYIRTMRRVSDVLLVSFNNQSLAAWWAYSDSMRAELRNWRMLALPAELKAASMIALLGGLAVSGWLSRADRDVGAAAVLALVAITVFSPIAWIHYYLALIPAAMVLIQRGGVVYVAVAAAVFLLNVEPLAIDPMKPHLGALTFVRSHFMSAVVVIFALAAHAVLRYRRETM